MNTKNSNVPLVSVGIPTYNRAEGLRRTLACITKQTYSGLQIIVSDNCSPTEEIEAVVREFMADDPRISYFRQPTNFGAWKNFLFVLQKAHGEYFMWAADDDEWAEDFVTRCISNMTGVGSVMCEFETVFRAKGTSEKNPLVRLGQSGSVFSDASKFLSCMQPTLFYGVHRRRDIQFALSDDIFDFYDCYFVLRLILGPGVRTIDGVSYRAGVDTPEYCIKTANRVSDQLHYLPFARKVMQLVWTTEKLGVWNKLILSAQFLRVLTSLFYHHERASSQIMVRIAQQARGPVRLAKRMCAKVKGFLRGFNHRESGPRLSYAQSGEDLIVDFIFRAMRVRRPSYLDIGAHHPTQFSNTYFFYRQGAFGVTVEPDPTLHAQLKKSRPNDIHLNVGVGEAGSPSLPFYLMSTRTLNTFSETEAERYQATGKHKIEAVINVPVVTIEEVFRAHFPGSPPDFMSIDVEGLDLQLIRTLDLARHRPMVVCVETLTFSESRDERKVSEIIDYMCANRYFVYADTYINSIFVDQDRWSMR